MSSRAAPAFGGARAFAALCHRAFPALDPLSENAYGIYLIHYDFVAWLQYLLLAVAFFAFFKGLAVFALTVMLSVAAVKAIGWFPAARGIVGSDRRAASKAQ